tara:strand:+ start:291 stop:491 length:201 start_codon:yes stop_codon:yes gene_type:complete
MSKSTKTKYKKLKEDSHKPTIESSIAVLKTQLKEYIEKAEHFKTMALKAEGALEVLNQLKETDGDS